MPRVSQHRKSIAKRLLYLLSAVLLVVGSANAQLELVDNNLKLNLDGMLGYSYGGNFSSNDASSHSHGFNGLGNLTGSYYHPNFINFNFQPYYNWAGNNSTAASTFDTTGFTSGINFFTGSRLPGSVAYSRVSTGTDQLGLPGVSGVTTEGSSDALTITWSALFPDWPTLTASFTDSGSDSKILGTNSTTDSATKTFTLNSTYALGGWNLIGSYYRQKMELNLPGYFGGASLLSNSGSTSYGASATHRLPMSGSFTAGWTRVTTSNETSARSENVSNNLNADVTLSPTSKLTLTGDVRYYGNLLGYLMQDTGAGVTTQSDMDSHSLSFGGFASYALGHGFGVRGNVNHRRQYFFGNDVSETLYGGTVTYRYSRPLLGMLYFNFGMVDTANQEGNTGLNFNGNVGFRRDFGKWETQADFSYGQNVQTLLATYTASSISYGASIRRQLNWQTYMSGSYRKSQSALVQREGEDNKSQTISSSFTWSKYSLTGAYSDSRGASVLTGLGELVPVPVGGAVFDNIVLFNGRSYTLGVTMRPLRKMNFSCSYTNAHSDTLAQSILSLNQTERVYSRLEYKLRQLTVIGNFIRYRQGISASGAPPSVINSYSIGIVRWFNVF
jgi:hypothetical protein